MQETSRYKLAAFFLKIQTGVYILAKIIPSLDSGLTFTPFIFNIFESDHCRAVGTKTLRGGGQGTIPPAMIISNNGSSRSLYILAFKISMFVLKKWRNCDRLEKQRKKKDKIMVFGIIGTRDTCVELSRYQAIDLLN